MGSPRSPADVATRLSAEEWTGRLQRAQAEAVLLEQALARVRAGEARSAVVRALLSDQRVGSALRRLRRFELGGVDGLVNRQVPVIRVPKIDEEARGALRALAVANPQLGSVALAERLSALLGRSVGPTTVQIALHGLDLARPRGRPRKQDTGAVPVVAEAEERVVTSLPLAGCELLKAVDEGLGAVRALTEAMSKHLDQLPSPTGPVGDDLAHRDDRGRFLPEYNRPGARTMPELGDRFETVEKRRGHKDLPAMRVAKESDETRARKNLGLVLLPCVVRGPRWSALQHWRGDQLGELIGYAYQASTLDKYLRELKLAGVSSVCRETVASFWLEQEGSAVDETTGAAVLYADIATKPLWTHHWTRCAKVSKTGRVMPAISTMTLHSGAGTPLVYRSWSGQVSLPAEIPRFLDEYERHAGEATVRRVVVMDREAHAVWLFKELGDKRVYIVPLRQNVVGPTARFEEVGEWSAYGPDEVCDGYLWLNDSRKGEKALRVRVAGRRRHRTGKVSWYATNGSQDEFSAADLLRLYFDRWPAQEHVYRDASGMVGLDVHHGYGKSKVDNVAILDRIEHLDGKARHGTAQKAALATRLEDLQVELQDWQTVIAELEPEVALRRTTIARAVRAGEGQGDPFLEYFDRYETMERWLGEARGECHRLGVQIAASTAKIAEIEASLGRWATERQTLETRRQIFTVDVELDEVMTAFKLTFLNLCHVLLGLLGIKMEVETLIDAVLTLPGEREVTSTTETVRIYRPERDSKTMEAVERACAALTGRKLTRDDRELRFEVTPRAPPDDPMDPRSGRR